MSAPPRPAIRRKASGAAGRSWRIGAAAALCALVVAADAQGETVVNNSGPFVTVPDNQTANPYPAELRLEGADGPAADVNVTLTINHPHPADLDIALVSPEGDAVRLMIDACGPGDLVNRVITFDDEAPGQLPASNCTSGTFRPTVPGSSTFPPPGPSGSGFELSRFDAEDPNGQWRLFVVDDAAGDTGSISSWGVTVLTQAGEVAIPAGPATFGIANPYPSTKSFPTPDGEVITDVNLDVNGFSHLHPDDVDMLLQGPGGENVMVMSDACGSADRHGFFWNFDDEAATAMSDTTDVGCFANELKPSQFGEVENLPAPAPAQTYGSTMSVFDGRQASDWRLFVWDDSGGDTGFIETWGLTMTTRAAAATGFTAAAASTAEGQTASLQVTRAAIADLGPATLNVDVNHSGTDPSDIGAVPAQLQFARGETSKTIEIPIAADPRGEGAEDFVASLTNAVDDAALSEATSAAVVTIARSKADNRFTVGKVKRLRNGSARVTVRIPNPGKLTAEDAGPKELLKRTKVDASKAGKKTITLKPAKKAKRKLKRGRKVKLTAEITYKPSGGSANSTKVQVKLKKKRR